MASNLENTINEDHLTCQICLSPFTKPKALPCLHTFCESCLVLYINRDGHQSKDRLFCPTCRTDIKMPENGVVGFPNNHLVISLQHTLSLADHSSPLQPEVPKVISEHGSAVRNLVHGQPRPPIAPKPTPQLQQKDVRPIRQTLLGQERYNYDWRGGGHVGLDRTDTDWRRRVDAPEPTYPERYNDWRGGGHVGLDRTDTDWRRRLDAPEPTYPGRPSLSTFPDSDEDEDDGYRRDQVMVPHEFMGRIIGTKGSRIKEIGRTTGTRLRFLNQFGIALSGCKAVLEITGPRAGIRKAKQIVEGIVNEEKDIHTDTMDVPDYAMGRIIGKGGSTIRALHESTGASITTAKLSNESSDGITLHRISIRGKSDQILEAKEQIEEIVNKITLMRSKIDESPRPSPSKKLPLKAEVVQNTTDTDKDLTPISYETIIEMTVPDKAVGFVIGKGGSRIKQVSEETGAQLIFKDLKPIKREAGDAADAADITDDTSTLVIRGSDTAAEQAVEKIRKFIQQLSIITNIPENNKIKTTKQSVMEIMIPQNLMRKVTGPQWSLIREVEEKSNTKIQLRLARQASLNGELAHRLIIRGDTPQLTLHAKNLIQELKDAVHIQMLISVKVIRQILGLTGEANGNIQDICRLSSEDAKIRVSNAGDETNLTTVKRVTISGKEDDANSLKGLLETFVNEAEQDIEARSTRTANGAGPDESADDFLECGCCFDDEVLFVEMGTCGNGHLFCQSCIQRSCEEVIGQGKAVFPCLAADCKMTFSTQELRAILPERLRESVLRIMQSEEIRQAEISDLVQCPHCSFGIIMPDNADTVLKCLNPECLKQTCRLCKEPKHSPLRCDQVEKQGETSMRTYMENKMAEAMIRKCYKCGKSFCKTEGCNKMTCYCGAMMCYVCRQPITDYVHFHRLGGCPLYSDVATLHTREATTAGQQAKERFRVTHPDLADLALKNDPLRSLSLE